MPAAKEKNNTVAMSKKRDASCSCPCTCASSSSSSSKRPKDDPAFMDIEELQQIVLDSTVQLFCPQSTKVSIVFDRDSNATSFDIACEDIYYKSPGSALQRAVALFVNHVMDNNVSPPFKLELSCEITTKLPEEHTERKVRDFYAVEDVIPFQTFDDLSAVMEWSASIITAWDGTSEMESFWLKERRKANEAISKFKQALTSKGAKGKPFWEEYNRLADKGQVPNNNRPAPRK